MTQREQTRRSAAPTLRRLSSVLLFIGALAGCNLAPNAAGQISERIGEVANEPSSKELDLGRLTSFGWDRLYLFKAGTTREAICQFLSANRNLCDRVVRYESVPAAHMAILFALDGRLTHIELHALANGEFDVDPGPEGLPRSDCVFRVRHAASTGEASVAHLEPIPGAASSPR